MTLHESRASQAFDPLCGFESHRHRAAIRATPPRLAKPPETGFWVRRAGGAFVRVEAATIGYAVIEEDYVRIVAAGRHHLLRESVRGLLGRLDPGQFIQVHRSALVRTSELAEVGRAEVVLKCGQRLPLGRVHGKAVRKLVRGSG